MFVTGLSRFDCGPLAEMWSRGACTTSCGDTVTSEPADVGPVASVMFRVSIDAFSSEEDLDLGGDSLNDGTNGRTYPGSVVSVGC